ncbi:hypothetical protein OPT61_g1391 [Boeremia exigua]|uniref:Uncharacterized protein n=1 Tax=Boeremia exigua TaxID=749465 RepID=A0ACC2IQC1_9PLEO|nr:hypothetical protein OPT61_g1391 [Boeremia exigua]
MSSTSPPSVEHPSLGKIRGLFLENNTIEQFRGIPFGHVPTRWTDSVLLRGKLSQDAYDATRHGPICPQGDGGQEMDASLVGDVNLQADAVMQSETECLNLVITRPVGLSKDTSVPILQSLQNAVLIKASRLSASPSNSYRLSIFGFLASATAGISGNFGLKDQICAFKWIRKNIEGFGGCPDSVTAFGESAGAISLSTLLATREPLFSRVILMSGDVSLRRPRTTAWQDTLLRKNLKHLGLENLSLSEAIEELRKISAEDIVHAIPLIQHWSPTLDQTFLSGLRQGDFYIDNTWCNHVMIGEMAEDGTILRSRYLDDPKAYEKTMLACDDFLDEEISCQIQKAYDLGATEPFTGMLKLISELRFYLPVIAAAKGLRFSKNVQVHEYHIHQTNPFEGAFHGFASHVLDLGYLLRNFDPWLDEAGLNFGKRMLAIWVGFAYGENESQSDTLALGPNHEIAYSSSEEYDQRHRHGRARLLLAIGLDKCVVLGERLQGVTNPEL